MSESAAQAPGTRIGAGAVVVRDNAILLVRLTYGWATGRWLLPNGGQHPGESLAECAVRELREETALSGTPGAVVALRSLASALGSDTFVALAVDAPDGAPAPDGAETDDARFFDWAAVQNLAAGQRIVRLHRLIAQHVLAGPVTPAVQTLPARDREGQPATSTVYFL